MRRRGVEHVRRATTPVRRGVGSDHDLILIGPHLSDRRDAISDSTRAAVAVLPDDVFADRDGSRTLALARSILADAGDTPKGTP